MTLDVLACSDLATHPSILKYLPVYIDKGKQLMYIYTRTMN